jgi:hypothetical protein
MAAGDPSIDDLYAGPLEDFTRTRIDIAKRLALAGDKEAAAKVKALAKPNTTAWVLNQLVRRETDGINDLFELAEQLRDAQQRDASDLRDLLVRLRATVAGLASRAQVILEESGRPVTQSTKNRITQTLMAAAADQEAGESLRAGRLTRELEPSGFGTAVGSHTDEEEFTARSSRRTREAQEHAVALEREAEAAEAEAARLLEEAERAERAAQRARARAEAAERSAASRRERADTAQRALGADL